MHKQASQEAVTSLHDLSAVDLIAGFRAKQFSPSEVLEDVLTHIAVWEPHIKALYAFDPDGARASPSPSKKTSPPRAGRCRSAPPASNSCPRPWRRRRRRACVKQAR